MVKPSGKHQERNRQASSSFAGRINGSGDPTAETSGMMMHNPGVFTEWGPEEQQILDDGLVKYASESKISCYAKIATKLPNKTIRDVALRCRYSTEKQRGKRRKEDNDLGRRCSDKMEIATDASSLASGMILTNDQISAPPPLLAGPFAGVIDELIRENRQILVDIAGNLESLKFTENIALVSRICDNMQKALTNIRNNAPGEMTRMPPLPVKPKLEPVNTILLSSSLPMQVMQP